MTAFAGSLSHFYFGGGNSGVDIYAGLVAAIFASTTSGLGAYVSTLFNGTTLKRMNGFFMLTNAALILGKEVYFPHQTLSNHPYHTITTELTTTNLSQVALFASFGCLSGFLAGLLGVGGGLVIVICSTLIAGAEPHIAVATSLICMVGMSFF